MKDYNNIDLKKILIPSYILPSEFVTFKFLNSEILRVPRTNLQ